MPVDILNIQIFNPVNANAAGNLRGGIGGIYKLVTRAYFHDEIIGVTIQFDVALQTITVTGGGILETSIRKGSSITTTGFGPPLDATYLVSEVSDTVIKVDPSTPITGPGGGTGNIYDTTEVKRIEYYSGLIRNTEGINYFDKLDGITERRWLGKSVDNSASVFTAFLPFSGKKHWITTDSTFRAQIGVTYIGTGSTGVSTGYEREFEIVEYFEIPPYVEDWFDGDDLDAALASWFDGTECMRFVPRIDVGNPLDIITASTDDGNIDSFLFDGNTGWYDETLNGEAKNFEIASMTFIDPASGGDVGTLAMNKPTQVNIVIDAVSGFGTIGAGSNKGRFGFVKVVDKDTYTNPDNYYEENTGYVAQELTGGGGPNKGPLTSITYNEAGGQLILDFVFDPTGLGYLEGEQFLLWVNAQDTDIDDQSATNETTLLVLNSEFVKYINVENIGDTVVKMIEHPNNDKTYGFTDYLGWVDDDILIDALITVEDEASPGVAQTISKVWIEVEVENNTTGDIYQLFKGPELEPGDTDEIDYQFNPSRPKKYASLGSAVVSGSAKEYTLRHGLKLRFEDWLPQSGMPSLFSGKDNKNWSNYFELTGNGYTTYISIYESRTIDGDEFIIRTRSILETLNWDEYDDCEVTVSFQTFGVTSGMDLGGLIAKDEKTLVIATFEGVGLDCYDFDETDFWGFLEWRYDGIDDVYTTEQISTHNPKKTDNGWEGTTGGENALLTKIVSPMSVELRAVLLTEDSRFSDTDAVTIMARLGKFVTGQDPGDCTDPTATVEQQCN